MSDSVLFIQKLCVVFLNKDDKNSHDPIFPLYLAQFVFTKRESCKKLINFHNPNHKFSQSKPAF